MTGIIKLVENIFANGLDNFKRRNPNTFVCFCCRETKKDLLTVMGALYGANLVLVVNCHGGFEWHNFVSGNH